MGAQRWAQQIMALDWGALTGKDQQRVKKLFELIDADKDGIISFQEIRTANGATSTTPSPPAILCPSLPSPDKTNCIILDSFPVTIA